MVSWEIEETIDMEKKKYNLRSRAHTNHVDFQAVNAIKAESSSPVKAGD